MSIHEQMRSDLEKGDAFEQAKSIALSYLSTVDDLRVVPDSEAIEGLAAFEEPMPDTGIPAAEVVDLLNRAGTPGAVAQTGGRYFGFVNGGLVPAGLAARWISDTWDQNAGLEIISPVAARLEELCEAWLAEIFDLPDGTAMGLVGGTSVGTFCGLAAARYSLLARHGWDVNQRGLRGSPRLRIVVSEQAHGTVKKALALLGFGADDLTLVPADSQGRIKPDHLPDMDDTSLVVLQAGNVNTGAFDDFETLVPRARDAGAWVHVDGAFGLWAAACPDTSHLTRGANGADSWSVDAHKTLNAPYDCGIVFCRDRRAFVAAMQASGAYIQFGSGRDGMLYGPDMSRRARSIELWAVLKSLGKSGIDELVGGLCNRARQLGEGLSHRGVTVLNDVVFNQVLVRGASNEETNRMLSRIQESGEIWCGPTQWNGAPAIRVSICSWKTTETDIDRAIELIAASAAQ